MGEAVLGKVFVKQETSRRGQEVCDVKTSATIASPNMYVAELTSVCSDARKLITNRKSQ